MVEGRWDEAIHHLEETLAVFAGTDERIVRLVAHGQLAEREVLAGNPAAIARLVPLLDRPPLRERMVTQYILPALAWAYFASGDMDLAAATAAEAIRRARAGTARLGLVHALRVQALMLLSRQCWAEAADALEEGLALARTMPYPHGEGRLLHIQGLLQAQREDHAAARSSLDTVLVICRRLGARKDVELVEREIAAL